MKCAILMSGNARSFGGITPPGYVDGLPNQDVGRPWARECFANQHWYLYRQLERVYGGIEFFVSLANDGEAHEVEPLLLKYYPGAQVHLEIVKQPTLPEPPRASTFHSAYPISSPFQSILRDLWHRERVWGFYGEQADERADVVVRMRPDLFFQTLFLPKAIAEWDCWTPFWGSFGGVSDRFAIMGANAAAHYFNAFSWVDELLAQGCPMHPETLTCEALNLYPQINIRRTLCAVFTTLRRDGSIVFNKIDESCLSYLQSGIEAVALTE